MNFVEYITKNFDNQLSKILDAIQKSSIQIESATLKGKKPYKTL